MTTLPAGVTLQQIDGGPTYYASNGSTNAVTWDGTIRRSSRLVLGSSSYSSQTDVNTWAGLGWNEAFIDGGLNLSLTASNGISVIEQGGGDLRKSPNRPRIL